MTAMSANRGGQIGERIELLRLARARHGQQTCDGTLAGLAAIAEHRAARRAFGAVIRRLDAVAMDEDEKRLMVRKQRGRHIAYVVVPAIQMSFAQGKAFPLDAAGRRITATAIPQPEQARMECQGVAAQPLGLGRFREVQRAQHVAFEVRPSRTATRRDDRLPTGAARDTQRRGTRSARSAAARTGRRRRRGAAPGSSSHTPDTRPRGIDIR